MTASTQPEISGDGRFATFTSNATNLDAGDLDPQGDVFVRNLETHDTELISRATGAAGANANGSADEPSISEDGRFVAFTSQADNLLPDDADTTHDIMLRDRRSSTTTLVSRASG